MSWPLPADPFTPTHTVRETEEMRHYRAMALQAAVDLHGEIEGQPAFRDDEITTLLRDARQIYNWIWRGDD